MACAITNMSKSVPEPFRQLTPCNTKRQLSGKYPKAGFILSSVQEKGCGPFPAGFTTNSIFVTSQRPVQRAAHHSSVILKGISRLRASSLRDWNT